MNKDNENILCFPIWRPVESPSVWNLLPEKKENHFTAGTVQKHIFVVVKIYKNQEEHLFSTKLEDYQTSNY